MNTEMALAQMGISVADLTPEQRSKFDGDGYFIAEDVFSQAEVEEMRSEFERLRSIEGDFGGHEVHIEPGAPRLSNLFNKSPAFDRCLSCKPTLAAAAYLLGEIRVYSLNARNPLKGQGQQPLHSDVPRVTPTDWRVVNSMVMLDDMTPDNGPTRVVPGSHKWAPINVPDVNMAEVRRIEVRPEDEAIIPKDPYASHPKEIRLTGKAGSVAVINGHIWHGGTRNQSGAPRRVLHLAIARRDLPQQLNEREHLTPELYARASPAQKFLLDIEGATPKVSGYPPLPSSVRTWAAVETAVGDGH
ncbi:MAG: phytanoyl-CoA dioxygenase family protein [Hyphomicrobiales bacterium]|nr:phytanoyl-CoA dioxygenase family protein [Hyphomicrobiales bacterium]